MRELYSTYKYGAPITGYLARLATDPLRQINRWVDWDQPIEVLDDREEGTDD